MFWYAVAVFAVLLQLTAIYCTWRAITSARTPQSSVGWAVFLLAAPLFAVPLYLVFGHHRYAGYKISRRDSEQVIRGVERQFDTHPPGTAPLIDPTPFERIADLRAVGGNQVDILIDGTATFEAIFSAIREASDYVLVQFFIVHDDEIGRELSEVLQDAARRGVRVKFMVDPVGSRSLPTEYFAALSEAGVEVVGDRQTRRSRSRLHINFRNHRKTVVVDGLVGFTGGHNVGDEYLGRSEEFGPWRDTHVRLRGPAVSQLQLVFAEDWHWVTDELVMADLAWDPPAEEADQTALVVATGPGDRMDTGTLFFFSAIVAAKERVWIASPYLVPDSEILAALKHAAISGKDVRLIVPEAVDHWLVWLSSFAFYDELRQAGVRIYRYEDGFMHQKVVLVDDDFAAIGTSNLDNRSFRLNFEMMLAVFDRGFAGEVADFLEADLAKSRLVDREMSERPMRIRIGSHVARLFAPLL